MPVNWQRMENLTGWREPYRHNQPVESGIQLCFAVNLGPPPADADEEESPIVEKFRGLAFKSVAYELQNPSKEEQHESDDPEAMVKEAGKKHGQRNQNRGDAKSMAKTIDRVLMATSVARNPLLTAIRAQHGAKKIIHQKSRGIVTGKNGTP